MLSFFKQKDKVKQWIISEINSITIPNSEYLLSDFKIQYDIQVNAKDTVALKITFPFPIKHIIKLLEVEIEQKLSPKISKLTLEYLVRVEAKKVQQGVKTINGVKNIIVIASGKGGVGKSTTTANLATALTKMGAKIGVLDADLYGPSQPMMLGVLGQQPEEQDGYFLPIKTKTGIQVMSIGFLIKEHQAVIWRGPLISQMLQKLLFFTRWDDLDYLLIDLPPGTGDIQLTIAQKIPVTGAVIVTTPQDIALIDARKAVNMFNKVVIPTLGVIENMSYYCCPQCGHQDPIFGEGGAAKLVAELNCLMLAKLPLAIEIRQAMDDGVPNLMLDNQINILNLYIQAAWRIVLKLASLSKDYSNRFPNIVIT